MQSEDITTILLIDDDPDIHFLIEDLLSDEHDKFRVDWASGYGKAFSIIDENKYDIYLVDYYLGEVTGPGLIAEFRSRGILEPMILLTGRADRKIDMEAMHAGATDFIPKDSLTAAILERTLRYARQRYQDALNKLKLESQLEQMEKFESLGRLSAGIAHEIKTPMQYIGTSISYVSKELEKHFEHLQKLQDIASRKDSTERVRPLLEVNKEIEECIQTHSHMKDALEEAREGVLRVAEVIVSMKNYAHPGIAQKKMLRDVNKAVQDIVNLSSGQWKNFASLELNLSSTLPEVPIYKSVLDQVLLNLIINASDSVREKYGNSSEKGRIAIATFMNGEDYVQISISDNGAGISAEKQDLIFDPFFTTKAIGEGSGQGLALSYSGIVKAHQGKIWVESIEGEGAVFNIALPVSEKKSEIEL